MALTYCVDFDDLCDEVAERSLGFLRGLKEKYPEFKCTLFTIPDRTSDDTILLYKEFPWIALAPHGWRHTRGECLTWAYHEADAKIRRAQTRGINAPAFRAPAWLINRPTYEVCRDLHLTVCDHKDEFLKVSGCTVYRYNDPAWRKSKIRPIHGHLTNCAVDNFIGDMVAKGQLAFASKSEYLYPWECAKPVVEDDPVGEGE